MQPEIEEAIGLEVQGIQYLPNKLIRFELKSEGKISEYMRFFLGEQLSADGRFPAVQNRKALDSNLASLAKKLDASLARMSGHLGFEHIVSRRDLLVFNMDHFCRPACIYSNGQTAVTIVPRERNRFEVAYHGSLSHFREFLSDFSWPDCLIHPAGVSIEAGFEKAERVALKLLTWTIRLRNGAEIEEVTLVPEEDESLLDGYPLHTVIAAFRERKIKLRFGGPPCGPKEAFRVLNEFRPDGFVVEACATCIHFRFSGMTRDWSAGSAGYCTLSASLRDRKSGAPPPPIVSVFHSCRDYKMATEDRYV